MNSLMKEMDINALIAQIETQEQDFILTALQTYNKEVTVTHCFVFYQDFSFLASQHKSLPFRNQVSVASIQIKMFLLFKFQTQRNTVVKATRNQLLYIHVHNKYLIIYGSKKNMCRSRTKNVFMVSSAATLCPKMMDNMHQQRTIYYSLTKL